MSQGGESGQKDVVEACLFGLAGFAQNMRAEKQGGEWHVEGG